MSSKKIDFFTDRVYNPERNLIEGFAMNSEIPLRVLSFFARELQLATQQRVLRTEMNDVHRGNIIDDLLKELETVHATLKANNPNSSPAVVYLEKRIEDCASVYNGAQGREMLVGLRLADQVFEIMKFERCAELQEVLRALTGDITQTT
jgi:hypothetical protein